MKANELRVGNLYDNNGNYFVVTPSTIESVFESERVWCKPIPLTEEILLKCGFISDGNNFELDWLLIHTHLPTGEYHFLLNEYKSGKLKVTKLSYLHQLQNLYHALTNEELEINL
jgi:hypothetical protein